ncbi:MAG: hypothetical protein P8X55_11350, partial [Desulfosarcinaceae bacterium]
VVLLSLMFVAGGTAPAMAQAEKGLTTVHVIGSSKIQGDNLSAGREQAVDSSLVTAVSRVLMEMLPPDTLSGRFQVINETILSRTDQFVRDYKVLTESSHAGTYRILVQVNVLSGRLADTLKRVGINLGKKKALRVLLCVAEKGIADLNYSYWWGANAADAATPAVSALSRQLMEGGLRIVNERAGLASGNLPPELSGPEAVALARQLEADLVVTGLAEAQETSNTMGNSIRSFRGIVDLKVFRTNNGQQIGQSRQVAQTAGDAGAGRVEMVVEGTGGNIANFVKFRGILGSMSGVDQVQLKEMGADTAVLSVQYQGRARALADALLLQNFGSFGINISEVGLESIQLKLVAP